jgi:hypothetical protein
MRSLKVEDQQLAHPNSPGRFTNSRPARKMEYSGFTIGVAGENASHGAFHQDKPHFSKAGSGPVIVKLLYPIVTRKNPMPLSGEAIRMMNYIDDISTTLRRILALAPTLSAEERKRVGEYLKVSSPSADEAMAALNLK